ncbi:MAG: N-6 DNA methylase, partial [Planctomycetales bacterium]|nr:N-6 DNA methylase [Planctomycetales bacterium]
MNFIEEETAEKLRGGYYTGTALAEYLLRWVREINPRTLLEPSCGDGAFYRPLTGSVRIPSLTRVAGCELVPGEARKAASVLASLRDVRGDVHVGDFLAWVLPRLDADPEFDAAVGNPPFVRYQYLSEALQSRAESLIRRFGLRFTRHTNAWVPFVVGTLNRLRPGGRLAMVVPAELLHVLHADSVRSYLLRECSRILVLDPEELWFEGALQGVLLLLAEKRGAKTESTGLSEVAITRIGGRGFISGSPESHFRSAVYIPGEALPAKWMLALLTAHERSVLRSVADVPGVRAFADVASVQVGIVTGANGFFLVSDKVVQAHDLGSYAHPMFGRSDHVAGVIYDAASHAENRRRGVPTNFLWFKQTPRGQLSRGAARYVASGEAQGLHRRFKCRIREPWYSVPSV